jgi:hypothetical protein
VAAEVRYLQNRLEESALQGRIPAFDEPNGPLGQATAQILRLLGS